MLVLLWKKIVHGTYDFLDATRPGNRSAHAAFIFFNFIIIYLLSTKLHSKCTSKTFCKVKLGKISNPPFSIFDCKVFEEKHNIM